MARAEREFVVLAVDDEPVVRRVVARALGTEFSVLEAASGQEALEYLKTGQVDLVLTDIMMPGMGGLDLADQILASFPSIPIAFLSAFLDEGIRAAAEQRSPHLLAKPVEMPELARAIRKILDRSGVLATQPPAPPSQPRTGEKAEVKKNLAAAAIVWQLKKTVESGRLVRVRVPDAAMEPALQAGDYVEVGRVSPADMRKGEVLFVHQGELLCVRRCMGMTRVDDRPHVVVRADSRKEDEAPVPTAHVIGRVVSAERGGMKIRVRGVSSGGPGSGSLGERLARWVQDIRNYMDLHGS